MTNNDILRRIRYSFDFSDSAMMKIFAAAEQTVTQEQVTSWLKKDDDPRYVSLQDPMMASFLNGLINEKRGKREGAQPAPEQKLTNNIILNKLKIALNLKAEDLLEYLELANFNLSKHELSAFFRKAGHKHYRECKDQVMRNFLQGLQIKLRGEVDATENNEEPEAE